MRRFKLTLAERMFLRPMVLNNWFQGNIEEQQRAYEVFDAVDFSQRENAIISEYTDTQIISCPNCGREIRTQQGGSIDLDALPMHAKEVTLEDRTHEFLVGLIPKYRGWPGPRKAIFSMREAIMGAEEVKAGEEKKQTGKRRRREDKR